MSSIFSNFYIKNFQKHFCSRARVRHVWAGGRTLANYSIKVFRAFKKALGILVPRVGLHVLLKVQPLGQFGEVGIHDFEVLHSVVPFWFSRFSFPLSGIIIAQPGQKVKDFF